MRRPRAGRRAAPGTVTIVVANLNDPPECAFSFAPANPAPGAEVRFTDLSVDRDGHVAAWSWDLGDGATSTVQSPAHEYAAEGTYRVVLEATDDLGAVAEYVDFVPVRYAPPVARDDAYGVDEGGTLTVATPGVLGNDGDLVATVSVAVQASGPAHGTLALSPDGSFTYVPAAGFAGADSFTYTVATGSQASAAVTVSIAVAPLNRPPTAAFAFSPSAPTTIDTVSFNDDGSLDPDGTIAAYSWDFGDGSPSAQGPTAAHRFATPGSYRVALTVIDDEGLAASATRDLHVTAYEAATYEPAPPGTTITGRQIVIDTAEAESAGGTVAVAGDRITITYGGLVTTITATGPPASTGGIISAEIASVTMESDLLPGRFDSTGPVEASFAARFDEFAQDATISATLKETPDPDVSSAFELAATSQALVLRGVAYVMVVEKAGIPAGAITGATVRMTAGAAWVAAQGGVDSIRIVRYDDAGAVTFLETGAEDLGNGLYRFTALSPGFSVFGLVGVNGANHAPTAADDSYATAADSPLNLPARGVLANDLDPDGDALSAHVVAPPAHGTFVLGPDGSFTYTPAAGFAGTDSFTYRANDGRENSNTATVTIAVSAANHAPTAGDDAYSTGAGTRLVVARPGVLANDDDADDDALTAALVETVDHGTLALSADGSFVYTPAAGFSGSETFTYRAHDGTAGSGPATVRITVQPAANRPPEITAAIAVPVDPKPVNTAIAAQAAVADPDAGDTVNATWAWGDGATSTVRPASGTVTGSHTYTEAGVYTVELSVTDGKAGTSAAAPQYTVVYDPNGGFVTGGGWIASPAGAYTADPSLAGKATFGFVSKYRKGQTAPAGETEFQFHAGGMDFQSSGYEWLVIANSKAQYKGVGTINGAGSYGFMLSAIDGDLNKVKGPDTFRIKIWDRNNRDAVVYDNQVGAGDSADPMTTLGGGSVVVHKA